MIDPVEEDADDLVGRVSVLLVRFGSAKRVRRRRKLLLMGLLVFLLAGGGVLLCDRYGEDLWERVPIDLAQWPLLDLRNW